MLWKLEVLSSNLARTSFEVFYKTKLLVKTYTADRDPTHRVAEGSLDGTAEMFEAGLAASTIQVVVTDCAKLERCGTLPISQSQRAQTNG